MKTKFTWLCIAILLISFCVPVRATETTLPDDSSTISQEILDLLPLQEGDQVIRIFIMYFYDAFYQHNSILDLVDNDNKNYMNNQYYVVVSADGMITDYKIEDGVCENVGSNPWCHKIVDTYLAGEVIKQIDADIIVQNAYYFVGSNYTGYAIYYITNMGTYVYLTQDRWDENEYLFSLEAFCAYEKARIEYVNENPSTTVVGVSRDGPDLNLSAYQIGSPNFNPNAPFPGSEDNERASTLWLIGGIALAVVLTAAAAWFFLRRKKKTDNLQV